jgi:hypothetical protein
LVFEIKRNVDILDAISYSIIESQGIETKRICEHKTEENRSERQRTEENEREGNGTKQNKGKRNGIE